ncbi:MAG: endolytic transglycosylase MltG [bacterium]|nr:endolytic transglycosylase MltG [bacterium]
MPEYKPAHGKHAAAPRQYASAQPTATQTAQGHYKPISSSESKPPKKKRGGVIAAILIVLLLAGAAGGYLYYRHMQHKGETKTDIEAGIEKEITIPEGALGTEIAQILFDNDIIANKREFLDRAAERGDDAKMKPGTYTLKTLMDLDELIDVLCKGPTFSGNKVTIREGITLEATADAVAANTKISKKDFLACANNAKAYEEEFPFVKGAYNNSLEGFLLPKTYDISDSATADDAVRMMLRQFETEVTAAGVSLDGANGYSILEIVTIASLIEGETRFEDERGKVASVIYNRLDQGIALQIDAAIIYALGDKYKGGGVTYDDLEVDSPYNVYKNPGLPPGPICSPSVESIVAATQPDKTNYLYYLVTEDDGHHSFFASYDDFLKAKNSR